MKIKRILPLLLAFVLTLCAVSCGANYRDDVEVKALENGIKSVIPLEDGYDNADANYVSFYFGNMPFADEYTIFYSSDASNINEVGIFHVLDDIHVQEYTEMVTNYVSNMKSTKREVIKTYSAGEMEKLENGKCDVYGNYIVYSFLSSEDQNAVMKKIEELLK